MVVLDWSRLIWAENQNNFDNSNYSLVCFKAADTFSSKCHTSLRIFERGDVKIVLLFEVPWNNKILYDQFVEIGRNWFWRNWIQCLRKYWVSRGCSRIGDQLGSLMAESGSGLIAAIERGRYEFFIQSSAQNSLTLYDQATYSDQCQWWWSYTLYTVIDKHQIRIQHTFLCTFNISGLAY